MLKYGEKRDGWERRGKTGADTEGFDVIHGPLERGVKYAALGPYATREGVKNREIKLTGQA